MIYTNRLGSRASRPGAKPNQQNPELLTYKASDFYQQIAVPLLMVEPANILTSEKLGIMMAIMRTTLTLDPDVARFIQDAVHQERSSIKRVVNDALRQALAPASKAASEPYHLTPHNSTLCPGIDRTAFNRLADELEDDAILDRARRSR